MAKRKKKRNRRHDAAFKSLYGFKLMAWGLMEVAQPRALYEELDFDTLERLPTEWFGPSLERRMGDCVWRVRRRGGGSLIQPTEFQRKPDDAMLGRVAGYAGLLVEHLDRLGELGSDGALPVVHPVVLYNGQRPWPGADGLAVGGVPGLPGYTLVDMGRVRVEDLTQDNPVAAQIDVHQGALARDPDAALARLSKVLGGPEHRALRLAFVEWIRQSLTPGRGTAKVPKLKARLREIAELGEFEEMKSFMLKSMEDHWLAQGMERGVAHGMERGVAQGMEQGVTVGMERARADERELLCRQACRKFGGRAADRLSALIDGEIDPDRLAEIGDRIIDCDTEAELLAGAQSGG